MTLALFSWAFPLFADQPILRNGISLGASALNSLIEASPIPKGMSEHYRWLFWRQMEGVGATLLACCQFSDNLGGVAYPVNSECAAFAGDT